MAGINNVTLAGRLVREPELRKTSSGVSLVHFTVAVDRRKKEAGADFVPCIAWRQQADFLSEYADKGTMVAIIGEIRTGSYEKDNQRIYTTEVEAERVSILDSKKARADYPTGGASVRLEEFTGTVEPEDENADLPF